MAEQKLGKGLSALLSAAGTKTPPPLVPVTEPGSGATVAGPPVMSPPQSKKNEPSKNETAANSKDSIPGISFAGLDQIQANPYQPRRSFDDEKLQELSESIRANGIIQPLVVRRTSSGYQLIAGERRLRASKLAGLKQVPVVIRRTTDRESLELAIVENVQRHDLNCIDEALAYSQLVQDFSLTQEQVSERVGKSRTVVANTLRLLRLPESVILDLKKDKISLGHGKAILSLDDREKQKKLHQEVVTQNLSVRDTESRAQELKMPKEKPAGSPPSESPQAPITQRFQTISKELSQTWGTKVDVKGNERRGKIVVNFHSREDLDRILAAMQNDSIWPERQT